MDDVTGRLQAEMNTETTRKPVPLWLLSLLTFSGTLAMHIFVPALPIAAADLNAGIGAMQMTVSLYIAGLAVGQLVYGPLSDRFGRRRTMMVGLALYIAAGLAAALAPDVHALIAARLFQALGGCAGLVLGRAIVRDDALPTEAARRLALMNLMVTLGPGLAPIVGSALASTLGWRAIFFALCGLGVTNFLLSWRLLPETAATARPGSGATLARNYWRLLRSPAFLGFAIGGGFATTAIYAFIVTAPFIIVHQLGRPAYEVGPYLAVPIFGIWLGSMLASRLIPIVPMKRLMVAGNALSVAAAFAFLAIVVAGHLTVPATLAVMIVFTIGAGTASPAALSEAISVNPKVIGSASGLYGFAQMAAGAICTTLAGLGSDPALSAAIVLFGAGSLAQAAFWFARWRSRPAV